MLKDKGQLSFEDKWPSMRPTILKLLRQETVTRGEWHDLFWLVHSVCLWDEKGPPKVYSALRDVSFEAIKVILNAIIPELFGPGHFVGLGRRLKSEIRTLART
jgi:hypothetical protein